MQRPTKRFWLTRASCPGSTGIRTQWAAAEVAAENLEVSLMLTDTYYRFDERKSIHEVDAELFAGRVLGITLQPFQRAALNLTITQGILNCSRQAGKTMVLSLKAVHLAFTVPRTTVAVLCPTQRQVGQFFRAIVDLLGRLGVSARGDGVHESSILLGNGSVIVGLPAGAKVRGLSAVDLLIVDEAAEVPDEAYHAVTPMLATTAGLGAGGLWLISTPMGRRGFFWHTWDAGGDEWMRLSVPASDCPRISPEFLKAERARKGELRFRQEYCCEFLDTPDSLFREDRIRQAIRRKVPKLWS